MRPGTVLAVVLGLAASASAASAVDAAAAAAEPLVASVTVLADPEIEADLAELIEIEVGAVLSADVVARTLTNFVAAGVASRVEVRQHERAEGLAVEVVVFADPRVVAMDFDGELGLDQQRLERLLEIREGDRLVEDRVLRSVFAMQDELAAEGYLDATVRVSVDFDATGRGADLTWRVAAGTRASIGAIDFQGELGDFTTERLRELAQIEIDDPARSRTLDRLAETLEDALVREGHPTAAVELVGRERIGPQVNLRLGVEVGPRLEVEVVGARLSELERRKLIPFDREAWDPTLVDEAVESIRRDYQERGYWKVAVSGSVSTDEGVLRVVLTVTPGEVWSVREVHFAGNSSVEPDRLRPLVATTPRRMFLPGSGRLVDAELEADRANLLSYYRLQGWIDAEVGPPELEVDEIERSVVVVFPIEEGLRRRIVRVTVEGGEECGTNTESLRARPGGPWHPMLVDESEAALLAACERSGYAEVLVRREEHWNDSKTLVDLVWTVDPGPRVTIDRVILRGARRSLPGFIVRASGLVEGIPLSRGELLAAERRLFRLGVFSDVDVRLAPSPARLGRRDVVIEVREGRTQRLVYGVGYDSEDGLGALLGYSHNHVAGRGYQLQLDLRASEATSRFRLVARRPEIGRRNAVGLVFTLFADDEERPAFLVDRHGARIEATRTWARVSAGIGLDYRIVDLVQLAEIEDPDRDLFDIEIASVIARLGWDGRDDPLDTREGGSSSVVLQQAFPLASAEEEFFKLFVQQTYHQPLGRLGTLAGSIRLGGIEPFDEEREIPIAERLYAGGRTTHRAFPRDRLGIIGETLDSTGIPVGGNGLVLFNLDWRFPIAGQLGGILFADGGNVWSSWRDVAAEELRWGVGIGARYISPVGPLRLEVGWLLDRDEIEDEYVVSFSFGNAF